MDYQSFKEAVVAQCQALGMQEYELYYQGEESVTVSVFQHEVNQFTSSTSGGVCLRCIVNGKMGYASTESLCLAEAQALPRRVLENAGVLESEEQVFLADGGSVYRETDRKPLTIPATDALISKVLEVQEQLYAASDKVVDGCETEGIAERSVVCITNSKGLDLRSETALTALVTAAVVAEGEEMANAYEIGLGDLEEMDTEALTQKAAQKALQKLGGEVAPTGRYPVVFSPEAMCSLLSVYSGIFSSEAAQKGLSRLADKEGSTIASGLVTLMDDPFYPGSFQQRSFDAEGSPTATKAVIKEGVLQTLLYNLKTAAVAGKQTTGNASKAGYDAPVAVRPFTMYLAAGEKTEEELLRPIEKGVYIHFLGGLHAGANPVSGDFSLQSAGFLIEDGKLGTYVKSFTVAGNFYDLLRNITDIASNLETPGLGSFGSPSVRVDGLSIAGK